MTDWYAPNQQAVRGDESGPAEEGKGGSKRREGTGGDRRAEPETAAAAATADYESMTKPELLELAKTRGVSPANNDMTKAEIIEQLEAAD